MGAILEYLNKRKEKWLKINIKIQMSDIEAAELRNNAEDKFSIARWVPDAAKKAGQLSLASHVCKFSHPEAKASPVISTCGFKNDGYLRSGNVKYELDAFGNAAAVDVFDFLTAILDDGRPVIEHLESDTEEIRRELGFPKEEYEKLRTDFLAIKKDNQEIKSDQRIKQVYFPVGDNYHLLSVMTPPGILRVLQARVNEIREEAILARDKNNEQYGKEFAEIYDFTVIAFGGTKPQNISVLNLRNNGKAYLLSSCPPTVSKRDLIRPKQDFFSNTLSIKNFRDDFTHLHALFECDRNNLEIRNKIKKTLQVIVDKVMVNVNKLRGIEAGWTAADIHAKLPVAQKVWLDDINVDRREKSREWLDEVSVSFARWIINTYELILRNHSIKLGDGEMAFMRTQVESSLLQDEGFWG